MQLSAHCPSLYSLGSIRVYGQDVLNSVDEVRKQVGMGVCPQHDVLFPDLTGTAQLLQATPFPSPPTVRDPNSP